MYIKQTKTEPVFWIFVKIRALKFLVMNIGYAATERFMVS